MEAQGRPEVEVDTAAPAGPEAWGGAWADRRPVDRHANLQASVLRHRKFR